jgi:hypothetical protein
MFKPEPSHYAPIKAPKRAAHFVWKGKVMQIDLDTKMFNCPQCGLRLHLPHHMTTDERGLSVYPSVVCDPAYGGCGWHHYITHGQAI